MTSQHFEQQGMLYSITYCFIDDLRSTPWKTLMIGRGIGWNWMGLEGVERDWKGLDGIGRGWKGWDGIGRDLMGLDGIG